MKKRHSIESNTSTAMDEGIATSQVSARGTEYLYVSLIYINIMLYAACFQMQRPLEPFMIEKLKQEGSGTDVALEYAKLQSFFSLIQVLSYNYI